MGVTYSIDRFKGRFTSQEGQNEISSKYSE
jgi:hypothetical protein